MPHSLKPLPLVMVLLLLGSIPASAAPWTWHIIGTGSTYTTSVHAADMDADGDLDVLATSRGVTGDNGFVSVKENLGNPIEPSGWLHRGRTVPNPEDVTTGDIDGDGFPDLVLATSGYANNPDDGYLILWHNNGGMNPSSWTEYQRTFHNANSVIVADINRDHLPDILGTSSDDGHPVSWWENNGSIEFTLWTQHSMPGPFTGSNSTCAADINGDGLVDIAAVSAGSGDLVWWENDGTSNTADWPVHVQASGEANFTAIRCGDIDNDGDVDIVTSGNNPNGSFWWENMAGTGDAWTQHPVQGIYASAIELADMDEDADLDIFGCHGGEVWLSNNQWSDSSAVDFETSVLFELNAGGIDLAVGDIDKDGNLDALLAQYNDNRAGDVIWMKQRNQWVELRLTPYPPVVLPPEGGVIHYYTQLRNLTAFTFPDKVYWSKVRLPNGVFYGTYFHVIPLTITSFMDVTLPFSQTMPAFAPPGVYEIWGLAGHSPQHPTRSGDSFKVFKQE